MNKTEEVRRRARCTPEFKLEAVRLVKSGPPRQNSCPFCVRSVRRKQSAEFLSVSWREYLH